MAQDERAGWSDKTLGGLAVLWVALSAAFKIGGNDIWWHIRTGRWIWENSEIPGQDPFSHTAPGAWSYVDWLSDLFFYGLDALGGADLLVAGKMLVVGVLAAILLKVCKTRAGPAALALSLGAMAMHMRLVLKPELFSFVGFALTIGLLWRVDRGAKRRELFFIPVVLLAWANFHRAGTIALLLLAAAGIAWALDRRKRRLLPWLAAALALSAAGLCINPAGPSYIVSAFSLSTSQTLRSGVAEWAPLSLGLPWPSVPCFLVMGVGWAIGWGLRRRKADLQTLAVLIMAVLSFSSVRFIPYAAMAMIPGLARDLEGLLDFLSRRVGRSVRRGLLDLSLAAGGLAALAIFYLGSYSPALRGTGAADWLQPAGAARFIGRNPPPGKMWNSLNQGGYLLYALAPGKKVFIDGRADTVYPRGFYQETLRARHDPRVLLSQLERHQIGFAVLEYGGEPLMQKNIFQHPDWVLVYWGDRSAVIVRRTERSRAYLERFGYSQLRVDTVLRRLARLSESPEDRVLGADILNNLKRAPGSVRAHYLAGLLHRSLSRADAYQRERMLVERMRSTRDLEFPLP